MQPLAAVPSASHVAQNPVGEYLAPAAGSGQFSSPQAGDGPGWPHGAPDPRFHRGAGPFNPQAPHAYGPAAPPSHSQASRYSGPGKQFQGGFGSSRTPSPGRGPAG